MDDIRQIAQNARDASRVLAASSGAQRTATLLQIAKGLREASSKITAANHKDMAAGKANGLEPAFLDRLMLNEDRVEAMAKAVENIAAQEDPIGREDSSVVLANGLRVARERIPLGVVAVIYEARPNVTSDAAALAIRSGNAIILKGGSAAFHSNAAVGEVVSKAIEDSGLPGAAATVLTTRDRNEINEMLTLDELIDVVIPRGGEGLIRHVAKNSRIPVIKHYKGVCHIYVDKDADLHMVRPIILNAKVQRPSVCNTMETLLVHRDVAETMLPVILQDLKEQGVTIHGCAQTQAIGGTDIVPATDADWDEEYLSLDLAVRVVEDIDQAIAHIQKHSSDHTEAILTDNIRAAQSFRSRIQSSCVMINASTRFADGSELGLGAEIGISTSRLHAYGPMGAEGLTTLRFVVTGQGQFRGETPGVSLPPGCPLPMKK